jgi:hypothetical protein
VFHSYCSPHSHRARSTDRVRVLGDSFRAYSRLEACQCYGKSARTVGHTHTHIPPIQARSTLYMTHKIHPTSMRHTVRIALPHGRSVTKKLKVTVYTGSSQEWAVLHEYIRMKHASTYTFRLLRAKTEGPRDARGVTYVGNTRHLSSVLDCALLLGIATSKFRFPSRNNP